MIDHTWCVIRTDDNGNRSVIARGLAREEAILLEERMASRGHKQLYEAKREDWLDGDLRDK